jgi:spectrin beta
VEAWTNDIESQLSSEDHGKDLASALNLLKRHTVLENDVTSHAETCNQLRETVASFQQSDHFMKEEIQERAQVIIDR